MWRSAEVIDGGNFCTIPMPGEGGRKSDKANAVIVDDEMKLSKKRKQLQHQEQSQSLVNPRPLNKWQANHWLIKYKRTPSKYL